MTSLSLRLRIFLFFCLIALGGVAIVLGALGLGYRQMGSPAALSPFLTVAIVSGFGLVGLAVFVWCLFDEHVAKPIERLGAQFRVRADAGVDTDIDAEMARYLGDLAPAAAVLNRKLGHAARNMENAVAETTARLERQCAQLVGILSDIPIAVIVATAEHKIVLYDGQAADLMEKEAPARLNASVFDYLEETAIRRALNDGASRSPLTVKGHSGANYTGHLRRFDAGEGYSLMLEPLAPDAARPLVYDFDLLDRTLPGDTGETDLRDLSFVVFDSETTGLDPARDAVVQLGAVRVVNGRIVPGEIFETLVNPGIPIPAGATRVHRIDDARVANAPGFDTARRGFHGFAQGAVIVAHNAPFDMAFLHRDARAGAPVFDNPVLDTVHLSAVVFGGSADHTLDALCARLKIVIPEEQRHTALGDAMATAEALVALIPILESRGLSRLDDLRAEIRRHSRILKVQT